MSPLFLSLIVFILIPLMLPIASFLLGKLIRPYNPTYTKTLSYESGMIPQGEGQIQFHAAYWPAALLFVIFDVEIIFLFPWAVAYDQLRADYGLETLIKMFIFLFFVCIGLIYAWRKKVLEWVKT